MERILNGYFLARKPSSDTFEVWLLFAREQGLVACLQRISSTGGSRKHKGQADLWDDMELEWNRSSKAGEHGPRFVKDYRITTHHEWLGQQWSRLEYATRLARMLECNLAEGEPRQDLFSLAEKALAAWAEPIPPAAIYLKFMLRWIHIEGYGNPLLWPSVSSDTATLWRQLLHQPVSTLTDPTLHWSQAIDELHTFLQYETGFHLPQ